MLAEKEPVKTLTVRLPKSEYDAIKQLSKTRGVPMRDLVRVSIWYAQFKDSIKADFFFQKG